MKFILLPKSLFDSHWSVKSHGLSLDTHPDGLRKHRTFKTGNLCGLTSQNIIILMERGWIIVPYPFGCQRFESCRRGAGQPKWSWKLQPLHCLHCFTRPALMSFSKPLEDRSAGVVLAPQNRRANKCTTKANNYIHTSTTYTQNKKIIIYLS